CRRGVSSDIDLRALDACGGTSDQRSRPYRGARFDDIVAAERPARSRPLRESPDQDRGKAVMATSKKRQRMRPSDNPSRRGAKVDPVITEIVRNGVIAVTEEMKTNLMRTAYNIIIYEALDFTTGLFTPEGETISIGIGLPMFIRGMAETVKAKIRHFGQDGIRPGDIYVTNDSYLTGSHLNHVTLTLPIFHKG